MYGRGTLKGMTRGLSQRTTSTDVDKFMEQCCNGGLHSDLIKGLKLNFFIEINTNYTELIISSPSVAYITKQ